MAGGLGGGGTLGGGSTPKSDKQKQSKAAKQLSSSLTRIQSKDGQSGTLLGYTKSGKQDFDAQKDNKKRSPFESVGSTILSALNVPSQVGLRTLQAQQTGTSYTDALKKAFDLSGHQTNLRGALNTDNFQTGKGFITPEAERAAENQGGRVAGAFDLAGTIVTDPLTYLGGAGLLGKASKAKSGLAALEKVGGSEIAAQAAQKGTKSLSPEVLTRLRSALEATPEAQRIQPGAIGKLLGKEATPETYANRILGGKGNALTRERGALEQAQGLKFAGKTVLPKTAFDAGAEAIGAKGAVNALERFTPIASTANKLGDFANKFKPRGQLADELGQQAADNQGLLEAGMRSSAAEKTSDLTRRFNQIEDRLSAEGINPDDLGRQLTPILESGQWKQAVDTYRAAGRDAEADYLQTAHDLLRVEPTQSRLAAGTLKVARPVDSYVSRQARPDALKQLQRMRNVPDELMSYAQESRGIGTEQQARKFMPDATIAEANSAIKAKTGIKDFFEPNAVKALGRKAVASYDELAKVDMLKKIGEFKDASGNSLLTLVPNNSRHIKDAERSTKAAIKDADKQFPRVPTRRLPEAQSTVNRLSKTVEKLRSSAASAAEAKTAALKAGTPNIAPQAAMVDKVFELKDLVDDLVSDPNISDALKVDAKGWLQESKAALAQEKKSAVAVTTGKKVQQSIGSTKTAASYEGKLLAAAEAELQKAQSVLQKAQVKDEALQAFKQQKAEFKTGEKVDRPSGYVTVKIRSLDQEAYMPRSMAQRLKELEGQGKIGDVQKAFETGTQVIKNLLLNATPLLVARNTRDFLPNLVNMTAVGFRDPTKFKDAGKVDLMIRKSYKNGLTHQEAIAALPAKYRELEEKLSEYGTVNTSQQRSDVSHNVGIGESNARNDRIKRKLNYKNAEAFGTKLGAITNDFVDNLSRRAMFYDQVAQHGDYRLAAMNTKKALFDYADLGEAEKKIRRFVVFWTFMARNTKLQAWTLANAPQVTVNVDRAKNEVLGDESSGNAILPEYAMTSGQVALGKVGDTPILGSVQSPFESATQTIQPLVDIAAYWGPEKTTTEAGWRGGLQGLAQNFGGAPGVLGKTVVEQSTGTDLFTGAPLKGTKSEQLQRALLTAAPRGTQYQGLIKAGTGGTSAERTAAALKLAGVSSTAVTDSKQTSELYRRNRSVTDSANRQGIPTVTELKKSASKKKTTQAK